MIIVSVSGFQLSIVKPKPIESDDSANHKGHIQAMQLTNQNSKQSG